jgi:hypothetical protein
MMYLASPYTHDDPKVVQQRFEVITDVAGKLMKRGTFVFSPIAHCHHMAKRVGLPKDFRFWEIYDKAMIDRCDGVIVAMPPGQQVKP